MKNIPIAVKILAATIVLGFVSIGIAAFGGSRLKATEGSYVSLLEREETTALWLARGSRAFQTMRASLAELLIATSDELNATAEKNFNDAKSAFNSSIENALKAGSNADLIAKLRDDALKAFDQGKRQGDPIWRSSLAVGYR